MLNIERKHAYYGATKVNAFVKTPEYNLGS